MSHPSTFSIVAFDPRTRELGIAVESKFLSVGAVVPWARAGAGAPAAAPGAGRHVEVVDGPVREGHAHHVNYARRRQA